MREYWAFCAGVSFLGMVIGVVGSHAPVFLIAAASFMVDLTFLLF